MSFSTVCRLVRKLSADVGPVIGSHKSDTSKYPSSPKIVELFLVKLAASYTTQLNVDMVGISKASALGFWRNIL